MKIGYFGTPSCSSLLLEKLLQANIKISFVVTGLDQPKKRNKKILVPSEVKKIALMNQIPVFQFRKFDEVAKQKLEPFNCDIFVVYAFGILLPKFIFAIPIFQTINLHGSLLPEFRGASPVQAAILNGKSKTGITLQYITERMDEGNIILQKETPIQQDDTGKSLLKKLTLLGAVVLIDLLKQKSQIFQSKPQNHLLATYCKKITAKDKKLNFGQTNTTILNWVRAFFDSYICYTFYRGKRIKILEAKWTDLKLKTFNKPGSIQIQEKRLFVECLNQSFIELTVLQPEGKKSMKAQDFINGYKIEEGNFFGEG